MYPCPQKIKHTDTRVESKEKIVEVWFRDMCATAGTLLFVARLSPAFWCGAVSYSQYCYNRMPNYQTGLSTPYQIHMGKRACWGKIRMLECDSYQLIPNDPLVKVPGKMKGRVAIFVGFTNGCGGYRVFGPESRRYSTIEIVYFYESFKNRVYALRHFHKISKLMTSEKNQLIQVDDWGDENAQAIRNLYANPELPSKTE